MSQSRVISAGVLAGCLIAVVPQAAAQEFTIDDMKRLEDRGVTQLGVGYRNPYEPDTMTLQQKIDWVRRFGDEIIAKL